MQVYTKKLLSGSTNGKAIKVTGTNTAGGVTIHTAIAGTTSYDEIWLWAFNSDTSPILLTIEFGGTTAPDQNIVLTIPAQCGDVLVVPGQLLQNGLAVTAFAGTANKITIKGYVHQIDP